MKKNLLTIILATLVVLAACGKAEEPAAVPVSPLTGLPQGTDEYPWWNDTVFYEIFVRSFYDSNDDGIGDFNGITEKMDYLNDGDPATKTDLGITGIWLMPINPSPSYHGYDVTDYYSVNPEYGSMQDFENLLNAAHERGIRVIIDMVLNHTSSEIAWFENAWDPASPYHDWYIWSDTKPVYNGPWGQKVWYPSHGQYYYALFWDKMPDLNYGNPDVVAEIDQIAAYWIRDVGVDGFRLDAIKYLVEEGANMQNTDSTHAVLQHLRTIYKGANPEAVTIGEVAGDNALVLASYTSGDQLDLTFEFSLASAIIDSANEGNAGSAIGQLKLSYKLIPGMQFAPFTTNHDQNRLMSQLNGDPNKVRVAASMLLTAPGVPFIYYGEEVGLFGTKPDEAIRRPMQWSGEKHAGFSTDFPWESVGTDYQTYNVAVETADPASILSHYRSLIQIRNEHASLRVGAVYFVRCGNTGIYAILRQSLGESVLVIINLTDAIVTDGSLSVEESGLPAGEYMVLPVMGTGTFQNLTVSTDGAFSGYLPVTEIPPYSTLILQLQPVEEK